MDNTKEIVIDKRIFANSQNLLQIINIRPDGIDYADSVSLFWARDNEYFIWLDIGQTQISCLIVSDKFGRISEMIKLDDDLTRNHLILMIQNILSE